MRDKLELTRSSWLVCLPAIGICVLSGVIAAFFRQTHLAAVLLFLALMAGGLVALGARYLAHVVSGYVLFAGWAEWYFTQEGFPAWGAQLVSSLSPSALGFVYSVVYNGFYMIPEMIFTAIAAFIIARPGITDKLD